MTQQKANPIIVIATTVLLAGVALAGCHEAGATCDEGQLIIGSILPMTGGLDDYGPSARNAVDLAVAHVNAAGGVNGQDVCHVAQDSETSEEASSSAVAHLINTEGIHALVGPMGSPMTLAVIDQVIEAGIPIISPSNTGPEFSELDHGGWYHRTVPSDALQGAVMAQLVANHTHETAAIIAADDPYGQGFGDVFEEDFESQGGSVPAYVLYDREAQDYSSDIEQAVADDPDAIVVIGYPDEGLTLVRQAFENGHIGTEDSPAWYFSEGFRSQEFVDELHDEQPGILEGHWGTTPEELTETAFRQDYEDEYGELPELFADRTYDAAVLLMLAAEHCGCTDGAGIRDSLREVQNSPGEEVIYDVAAAMDQIRADQDIIWTGAAGPLEFDEVGDVTAPYSTWQIVDGNITVQESGIVP